MIHKKKFFSCAIFLLFCLASGHLFIPADAGDVTITGNIALFRYNLSISNISSDSATLTWTTNGNSNSIAKYGITDNYGTTVTNTTLTSSHYVMLTPLSSFTTYHYNVSSTTNDGLTNTSTDATFKTTYPNGYEFPAQTATTTIAGVDVNTTSNGNPQVNISSSVSTTNTTTSVTIQAQSGSDWDSIQYVGSEVVKDTSTGTLSVNNIQSVVMSTKKLEEDLGGNIGTASAKIDIPLTKPVTGVTLSQKIIQGATTDTANAFQLAATSSNLDIKSVAYTVKFENTAALNSNLSSTGTGVTLKLGIAHDWVLANGGTGSIKVFRFGDDGTREVLSTSHDTGSSTATTDYFTVISPHGLSTFGMTAVASTVSGGGGGSGGSGGGDSTTSISYSAVSRDSSEGPVAVSRAGPVQQALAPVIQEINKLLAPFQESVEKTRDISVAGLSVTTKPSGTQTIRLATGLAEQSGATVSVTDNRITINKPDFSLIITTSEVPVIGNGEISGTVSSVELSAAPTPAALSIGTITFSLHTPLAAVPETATLTTLIAESVTPDLLNEYQSTALENNKRVDDVAYSVTVTRNSLATTGPATVMLTAPPDWVLTHGGTNAVGIVHIADDGTAELLTTTYSGQDTSGNIIFEATSPNGLSSFSLVALKDQPVSEQQTMPGRTSAPASIPSGQQEGVIQNTADATGKFVSDNLAIVIGAFTFLLAAGVGIIVYERRSGSRKKQQKKE